ncbi:hypothetical protein [Seonamhaeicola marinus]|uniref:Uncharacterized protein n=1 Tax=Seonamhaeicola marinus TaxID=1912246 RepID=A0A5D0HFF4_9FLAO|nr:hypothetical protein [Seonamhaeicola marinus]TYA70021.1 hypothetical protein FUA24_22295 [Seonamhaeicola marinus]
MKKRMLNLIKGISLVVLSFIAGFSIAFFFESFLRGTIQDIFRLSTSNKIHFYGKNMFIFSDRLFKYFLGLSILIFIYANLRKNFKNIITNTLICLFIFGIAIFLISAIDANIKVLECTNCKDGIRGLHWTDINYDFIIGASAIISTIPYLVRITKHLKKDY